MKHVDTISFIHEGEDHEARVFVGSGEVRVCAFHNDARVNRFTYSATTETALDFSAIRGESVVEHLLELAITDVQKGVT